MTRKGSEVRVLYGPPLDTVKVCRFCTACSRIPRFELHEQLFLSKLGALQLDNKDFGARCVLWVRQRIYR